ncbi:MAG: DMT family transporter [Hyphomicrobiales bacterium]|nr:DMT family transporter [Hyphomicrobiales bacterium]
MLIGIGMRIAAAFAFAIMATLAKLTNGGYSIGQIVFFRSLFALAVLVLWLRARGDFPRAIYTKRPLGHLARGTGGTGGMFSYFLAVALLPLPDVTAIGYLAPLLVVALAAVVLGETVRVYRWSAVAIGFVGVLVMVSEHLGQGSGSRVGALAALSSAAFAAYAVIQTRRLAQSETTGAIVFYFSVLTSAFGFLLMTAGYFWPHEAPLGDFLAGQKWATPGWLDLALLIGVGLFGGVGQILMTDCVRYADASVIAPFEYTSIVFAMALGWFVFAEKPTTPILVGSAIVIAAGLFVLWREHKLGLIRIRPQTAGAERTV